MLAAAKANRGSPADLCAFLPWTRKAGIGSMRLVFPPPAMTRPAACLTSLWLQSCRLESMMQTGTTETIEWIENCFPNTNMGQEDAGSERRAESARGLVWKGDWDAFPVNSSLALPLWSPHPAALYLGCVLYAAHVCGILWASERLGRTWICLRHYFAVRPLPSLPSCCSLGLGFQRRMGDNPLIGVQKLHPVIRRILCRGLSVAVRKL